MSPEIHNMIDRKVINSNAKEVAVFLWQIRALTGFCVWKRWALMGLRWSLI